MICSSFSALQRAENSSIITAHAAGTRIVGFSALQRAENSSILPPPLRPTASNGFSALQRAENSSIVAYFDASDVRRLFQCSSASRKFLNCSSRTAATRAATVSVLFSEPKIPQFNDPQTPARVKRGFSALQRAENSSMWYAIVIVINYHRFQCSSASRKFLNLAAISPKST